MEVIRHNQEQIDAAKVSKLLGVKDPFKGRHNRAELLAAVLKREEESKRYVYERGSKNGKPTLKVTDRYLAPHIVNTYEFAFTGIDALDGYGALLIEKLIKMLGNERRPTPQDQMAQALR